ncbi:hypothetical protein [Candidatus Rariloculus sp.]|uniref:hypothetical protein n=1 Tax=Candidatus Rariloculus sp. TaxID=3101265 RepID=UPI003D0EB4CC
MSLIVVLPSRFFLIVLGRTPEGREDGSIAGIGEPEARQLHRSCTQPVCAVTPVVRSIMP